MCTLSLFYVGFIALLLFPVQTLIHELSHTIVPRLKGNETSIRIFPGFIDGSWYWGVSFWNNARMSQREVGLTYIFPRFVNVLQLATFSVAVHYLTGIPLLVAQAFLVVACVDFSYNTIRVFGSNSSSDANMTLSKLFPSLPSLAAKLLSILFIAGAVTATAFGVLV